MLSVLNSYLRLLYKVPPGEPFSLVTTPSASRDLSMLNARVQRTTPTVTRGIHPIVTSWTSSCIELGL